MNRFLTEGVQKVVNRILFFIPLAFCPQKIVKNLFFPLKQSHFKQNKRSKSSDSRSSLKSLFWRFVRFIDSIIEHKLFNPLSLTVIIAFLLLKSYQYGGYYLNSYKESQQKQKASQAIKISLSSSSISLDINEDQIAEHIVKSGDSISKILSSLGASDNEIFGIVSAIKKINASQLLSQGNKLTINYRIKLNYQTNTTNNSEANPDVIINNINFPISDEEQIVVSKKNDGTFDARQVKIKLLRYNSRYFGVIKNGLFVDGVNSGISASSMMNMINLYGYDVDFQRDIHEGDKFEMLVESFYDESGKKVRDGNVLFSSLILQNRSIEIYMHKIDGRIEYFDAKGNSVKKSLLRTPINGARVSSGFGMRRHPILGYSKMHKGIDFSAASGTPILAAGVGIISYMGVKGGYGNYVQIRHNADYSTAYGHASRFNKKFSNGSKVKQGDIIAYVGTTGRSTGPHLHFELIYRGSQVNPSKVKATSGLKLSGKELVKFEAVKDEIDRYRRNTPNQFKKVHN